MVANDGQRCRDFEKMIIGYARYAMLQIMLQNSAAVVR